MLPKAIIAAMMALALGVPAGIGITTGGLGPLKFSWHPFGGDQDAAAPLPQWKAGDSWTYTLKGSSQAPADHARFTGNLTVKVEGVVNKTKAGLTEDAYNLTLSGDLKGREQVDIAESQAVAIGRPVRFTDTTATISGKALVGTQDLALIMERVDIAGGAKRGNLSLSFSTDVVNRYTPALPLLKFPLKVGETWAQDVKVKSVGSVSVTLKGPMGTFTDTKTWDLTFVVIRTAEVMGFGNATVPAGTFTAFKVLSHRAGDRDGDQDDSQAKDDQGVEVEDSQVGAEQMASSMAPHDNARPMSLLRFSPAETLWYSPEVKNVVAFRLHFPGPLGRTKVMGELTSFHLG